MEYRANLPQVSYAGDMDELEAVKMPQATKRSYLSDDDYLLHDFVLLIDLS